jgi:uncharacterized protein YcbK (DUF882 family)
MPRIQWLRRGHAPACPCCDAPEDPARRGAIGLVAAAVLAPALAPAPAAAQSIAMPPTRRLVVRRSHTSDGFSGVYFREGRYDREALQRLDWVFRDISGDEVTPMDPRLFDILWTLADRMGSEGGFDVISGYRAPETNAARARQSRRVSRVSLHMSGMACDTRISDRDPMRMARLASEMQTGGVGLYRRDGFVHLDCGPARRW